MTDRRQPGLAAGMQAWSRNYSICRVRQTQVRLISAFGLRSMDTSVEDVDEDFDQLIVIWIFVDICNTVKSGQSNSFE
jgi:hypothetical protein